MNRIKLLHIYRKLLCWSRREETGKDCSRIDIDEVINELLPMLKEYLNQNEYVKTNPKSDSREYSQRSC